MMKKTEIILLWVVFAVLAACNGKKREETLLKGKATIYVDETLAPIVADEAEVFESAYDATLTIVPATEAEVLNSLTSGKATIAVLARRLDAEEQELFAQKKIIPRMTEFATDGIALIRNKAEHDTLVDLEDVMAVLQGRPSRIKGLVFDNPNSSTARYLYERAGISAAPETVYAAGDNRKAIDYIASHDGMVGVVGMNWLAQPPAEVAESLKKIQLLGVKGKDGRYYTPTQNDIAEDKYVLARPLVVVDCQGYSGLGMGFASFVAGERGQRIVLKSGLLPARIPSRKIVIRNTIDKSK